jgi:hypothetical protein
MAPPKAASDHFSSGESRIGGIGASPSWKAGCSAANKAFSGPSLTAHPIHVRLMLARGYFHQSQSTAFRAK